MLFNLTTLKNVNFFSLKKKLGKIEELYYMKLNWTIQYADPQNIHSALYGSIIIKFFDTEAIIIALLILHFSHFNIFFWERYFYLPNYNIKILFNT